MFRASGGHFTEFVEEVLLIAELARIEEMQDGPQLGQIILNRLRSEMQLERQEEGERLMDRRRRSDDVLMVQCKQD